MRKNFPTSIVAIMFLCTIFRINFIDNNVNGLIILFVLFILILIIGLLIKKILN